MHDKNQQFDNCAQRSESLLFSDQRVANDPSRTLTRLGKHPARSESLIWAQEQNFGIGALGIATWTQAFSMCPARLHGHMYAVVKMLVLSLAGSYDIGVLYKLLTLINNGFSFRDCSGSVVECLTRDRGVCVFEPQRLHCVVSLSKKHLSLLSTGSTQEDLSPDITEKVKNQT